GVGGGTSAGNRPQVRQRSDRREGEGRMIAVQNLTLHSGGFALECVSFMVETGEYAVLMGKTGSGKTTLLEAVCGLKPLSAGRIVLLDRDVTDLHPAERGVGYVPQDLALFQTMSVRDHLAFALEI